MQISLYLSCWFTILFLILCTAICHSIWKIIKLLPLLYFSTVFLSGYDWIYVTISYSILYVINLSVYFHLSTCPCCILGNFFSLSILFSSVSNSQNFFHLRPSTDGFSLTLTVIKFNLKYVYFSDLLIIFEIVFVPFQNSIFYFFKYFIYSLF